MTVDVASVSIQHLLLTELFTSTDMPGLIESLKKLLAEQPPGSGMQIPEVLAWIPEARANSSRLGWHVIGTVADDDELEPIIVRADRPECADRVALWLFHSSTAMTALAARFAITVDVQNEVSEALRPLLNEDIDVDYQHLRAVEDKAYADIVELRARIRHQCAQWLNERFAGLYATRMQGEPLPCVEFLQTGSIAPFANSDEKVAEALRIERAFNSWRMTTTPSVRLGQPISGPWSQGDYIYAYPSAISDRGERPNTLGALPTLLAMTDALRIANRRLAHLRDTMDTDTPKWRLKEPLRKLQDTSDLLLTLGIDSEAILAAAGHVKLFQQIVGASPEFVRSIEDEPEITFSEALGNHLRAERRELRQRLNQVREVVSLRVAILTSIVGLSAQMRLLIFGVVLAFIAAIVGIASLGVSVIQRDSSGSQSTPTMPIEPPSTIRETGRRVLPEQTMSPPASGRSVR